MIRKNVYPETYNDKDKAIYDSMILQGESAIGKIISKNEYYLLDIAAKMTINQMKGITSGLSKEEVEEIRLIHKKNSEILNHETPPDIFYNGLLRDQDGNETEHPLLKNLILENNSDSSVSD
tara:strand:- start:104 stop:469 length:366 start_codon:yes stop_codon:yes gene_type:complete